MARQALGRGLSALLGEQNESQPAVDSEIDIDLIDPNPEQPRSRFTDAELDELALSIKANGIVQPIVVRPVGSRFQIVAGERRWRAAQRAVLRRVPAVIRAVTDEKLLEIALIENIQRQELNPIEEANAYRKLIDQLGLTQEQLSERIGKERTLIATTLRLLQLSDDLQKLVIDGSLSLSHGRALLLSSDRSVQRTVANLIISRGMSVRDAERTVRQYAAAGVKAKIERNKADHKDPNVKLAETKLMRKLSTNVKIVSAKKGSGGKIEIEYYGTDDLDRLYELLMK